MKQIDRRKFIGGLAAVSGLTRSLQVTVFTSIRILYLFRRVRSREGNRSAASSVG